MLQHLDATSFAQIGQLWWSQTSLSFCKEATLAYLLVQHMEW